MKENGKDEANSPDTVSVEQHFGSSPKRDLASNAEIPQHDGQCEDLNTDDIHYCGNFQLAMITLGICLGVSIISLDFTILGTFLESTQLVAILTALKRPLFRL